jgi:non-ribosomal peptide synthetase component F
MRIAGAIGAARGHKRGGQCALFVDRSRTAYTSVLGALLAGLAYVPLNSRFPQDRILEMLTQRSGSSDSNPNRRPSGANGHLR